MSRVRLVATSALVVAALAKSGWFAVQTVPLQVDGLEPAATPAAPAPAAATQAPIAPQTKPVVDPKSQAPRPGVVMPPPQPPSLAQKGEVALKAMIEKNPTDAPAYFALSKLYEDQGKLADAERILLQARAAQPGDIRVLQHLAGYYSRRGDFDRTVEVLRERTAIDPLNAEGYHTLATWYWERAYRVPGLSNEEKHALVTAGHDWVDKALRLKPDYVEALTYKNLLFRLQASLETDPAVQQSLIAKADTLRDQATAIRNRSELALPPNALRVGGNVKPPRKLKDVRPAYPAEARDARVQGVVILEVLISETGEVDASKVRRSIPLLDQAALEAVNQWEFEPTLLNGAPVPVAMTVTVNFVLDGDAAASGAPLLAPPPPASSSPGAVPGGVVRDPNYPPNAVRIGGNIRPPAKLIDIRPVYPEDAKTAGIQGVVIIETVIGTDGRVSSARVLRSIPPLDQAALDAVTQWQFTPTALNGILVPVIMTVTVNFTLQ